MVFSEAFFSQAGENAQPSPSIWGDCPGVRLRDEGTGFFFHEDFFSIGTATDKAPLGPFSVETTGTTVFTRKAGEIGGYLDIETGASDTNSCTLGTATMAEIVLNSGNKVWFEARLELGALADQGVYIGLMEETGFDAADEDVLVDDCASLVAESLLGFQILAGDTDAVDFVFKLDGGTAVVPLADINLSTNGGNTAANLVADTEFKIGLKFDGKEQIQVFYNGNKVLSYTIVASTFPDNVKMGVVVSFKTGTAAAQSIAVDWVRAAYQVRR